MCLSAALNRSVAAEFHRGRWANKLLNLDKPTRIPTTSKVRRCFSCADISAGVRYFVEFVADASNATFIASESTAVGVPMQVYGTIPEPNVTDLPAVS